MLFSWKTLMRALGDIVAPAPGNGHTGDGLEQKRHRQRGRPGLLVQGHAQLDGNMIRNIVERIGPVAIFRMVLDPRKASPREVATDIATGLGQSGATQQLVGTETAGDADVAIMDVRPDIVEIIVVAVARPRSYRLPSSGPWRSRHSRAGRRILRTTAAPSRCPFPCRCRRHSPP